MGKETQIGNHVSQTGVRASSYPQNVAKFFKFVRADHHTSSYPHIVAKFVKFVRADHLASRYPHTHIVAKLFEYFPSSTLGGPVQP